MTELADVVLRLGCALLIGAAIGLNRDLKGKPIGVRTLGLVGLASAIAVVAVAPVGGGDLTAPSRVIQGVLTGIGFLGAGVIVRSGSDHVRGLTSAACTWVTACLGLVCGLAAWPVVAAGTVLVFVLLILGGPVERKGHRLLATFDRAPRASTDEPGDDAVGGTGGGTGGGGPRGGESAST